MNQIDDTELARRLRADIDRMVGDAGSSVPPPAPTPTVSSPRDRPTSHRWVGWSAAAATVALLVGGLVVLANRGSDDEIVADVPPVTTVPEPVTVPPTTIPVVVGDPVEYEVIAAVIENGTPAPMLCFSTLESMPPQCGGGLPLVDWSWEAIDVEQADGDIRWVDSIYVRGNIDGGSFVVHEARIPTDAERGRLQGNQFTLDFSVPCPEPEGGWPARRQEWPGDDIAAIEGYAGAWVDESQQVMTVKFTGDLAVAQQQVEQYYSGAVCVVAAQHTEQELLAIQQQLMSMSSVQFTSTAIYIDATGEWVQADLALPNDDLQASFDEQFGTGVVRLSSPFHPVAAIEALQMVEGVATVLADGSTAPRLCVEGILDSFPPQCAGGPELVGFSWDAIPDEESSGTTTWGTAYVRGEYDPETDSITVSEQRQPDDDDAVRFQAAIQQADHSTPCEAPAGGWPVSSEQWPSQAVAALDGYAGAWSEPGGPMTVKLAGDLEAARTAIAAVYSGPVCVVQAERSLADLSKVRQQVEAIGGWVAVDIVVDASGEWVVASSVAPQPVLQAELDGLFGPGVVRIESRLLPVA